MLRCFALFVCLTLLASFFLPSHLSFKNMYNYNTQYMYTYIHVIYYMYMYNVHVYYVKLTCAELAASPLCTVCVCVWCVRVSIALYRHTCTCYCCQDTNSVYTDIQCTLSLTHLSKCSPASLASCSGDHSLLQI